MRNVENNGMHLVNDRIDFDDYDNNKLEYGINHLCGIYNFELILDDLNLEYEAEKSFPDLYVKKVLRYDYYIKELNLLIEIDDHSHYRDYIYDDLSEHQRRDILKSNYAEDRGIHLIRFPYWCTEYDIRYKLETFRRQYYEQHKNQDQYYFIKNVLDQFQSYSYIEMNIAYELYLKKCNDLYIRDKDMFSDYQDFKDYVIDKFQLKYHETIYKGGQFREIYSALNYEDYCQLYLRDKRAFDTNHLYEFINDEIALNLDDQYKLYDLYDLYCKFMRIHYNRIDDLINICEFSIQVTDYMTNLGYERYTLYRDDENDKCQFVFKKMNYKRYEFISKVYDDVKQVVYHNQNNGRYNISLESVFNIVENYHDIHRIYELVRSQTHFELLDASLPPEEYRNQLRLSELKRKHRLAKYYGE